jgi:hypothetical protein
MLKSSAVKREPPFPFNLFLYRISIASLLNTIAFYRLLMKKTKDYTSIQLTPKAKEMLRKNKKDSESYEDYLRRRHVL